ncbi:Clp protease [Xylanimonas oleitrophica]|uniref:Clp protease n=1 Tax=Xylanimonas oleitrophica TaxID=2607479 RepID=A0A2W5WTZ8_9MICO|nr:Clp protease N-terminal domain-containing protein [Xylanimonas oleitrophica]PZR54949.1 Clp protease [Xylanimonas oleitrophica]
MFERFTGGARAAVVTAQEVARALRSEQIDTRHLLVALLEDGGHLVDGVRVDPAPLREAVAGTGVAPDHVVARARAAIAAGDVLDGEALASLGIDLDTVRARADEVFGAGALDAAARRRRRGTRGHVPFTGDAKKALELALREALRLQDKSIGPRHLLLGLLRADCPGGRVLADAAHEAGVDLPALRTAVEAADAA